MADSVRNPKNLVQVLKCIRNQDQNQNAFSLLPTFKKRNENWKKNERLVQCLRLMKLKFINQNTVTFVVSPHT